MVVVGLWEASVSTYNDDVLVQNYCYEDVFASRQGLAIGSEGMRVLMRERTTATREQICFSQISSGAALHVPLDAFGAILPAAQFGPISFFLIPPICIIRYFAMGVQDRTDGHGGFTLRRRFCAAAWWEISLCVTRILRLNFLLESKCRCFPNLLCALSEFLIDLLSGSRTSPTLFL